MHNYQPPDNPRPPPPPAPPPLRYVNDARRPEKRPPPTTEESPDFTHDILVLRFLWASGLIAALSFVSGYFCRGLF